MRFLIVEDDYLQGDATYRAFRQSFPKAEVDWITTESEFYEAINTLVKRPPTIIIMDIKIPWRELSAAHKPAPDRVREEGDRRAGLRCWELMSQHEEFRRTAVLFFSQILDDDLEADIQKRFPSAYLLRKGQTSTNQHSVYGPLIEKIRSILSNKSL